jgi:hypothetical protein
MVTLYTSGLVHAPPLAKRILSPEHHDDPVY